MGPGGDHADQEQDEDHEQDGSQCHGVSPSDDGQWPSPSRQVSTAKSLAAGDGSSVRCRTHSGPPLGAGFRRVDSGAHGGKAADGGAPGRIPGVAAVREVVPDSYTVPSGSDRWRRAVRPAGSRRVRRVRRSPPPLARLVAATGLTGLGVHAVQKPSPQWPEAGREMAPSAGSVR